MFLDVSRRMRDASWCVAVLLCLAVTLVWAQSGNLEGELVTADGDPLPGATVTLSVAGEDEPRIQITDPQGHYRFEDVAPGRHHVTAELDEFVPESFDVLVRTGDNPLTIALQIAEERGLRLPVDVQNAPPNTFLTLLLQAGNDTKLATGTTDDNGRAQLSGDFSAFTDDEITTYVAECDIPFVEMFKIRPRTRRVQYSGGIFFTPAGGDVPAACDERVVRGDEVGGCNCRSGGGFLLGSNADGIDIRWDTAFASATSSSWFSRNWWIPVAAGGGAAGATLAGGSGSSNSGGSGSGGFSGPSGPLNRVPTSQFSVTPGGQGMAGVTVFNFDAGASSDPDGNPLTHAWAFGDGSTGSGQIVTHTFQTASSFNVTHTVTDGLTSATSSGNVGVAVNLRGRFSGDFGVDTLILDLNAVGTDLMVDGTASQVGRTPLQGDIAGTLGNNGVCPCSLVLGGVLTGSGLSLDFSFDGTVTVGGIGNRILGRTGLSSGDFQFAENVELTR